MTGCCCLPSNRRRIVWKRSRKFVFLGSLSPVMWLLFVFIDTKYYVCSKLGPLDARLSQGKIPSPFKATDPPEMSVLLTEYHSAQAESQIIPFLLLSVVILVSTIFISLDRCCTKADSSILNEQDYVHYLVDEQIKLFNSKTELLAKEEAKEQVKAIF